MQHDFGIIPRKIFSFLRVRFSEMNLHETTELISRVYVFIFVTSSAMCIALFQRDENRYPVHQARAGKAISLFRHKYSQTSIKGNIRAIFWITGWLLTFHYHAKKQWHAEVSQFENTNVAARRY